MYKLTKGKVMKLIKSCAIIAVTGLAACGGGTDPEGGVITSGILTDVSVPSDAELQNVPQPVRDLVSEFVRLNESYTRTEAMPTGSGSYTGNWGIGFDDNDVVIIGDMALNADFDGNTLTGTVSNLQGDENGTALDIQNSLSITSSIAANSRLQGTATGVINVEGENYNVESSLEGAFGGDNADALVGTTNGLVTNPDNSQDSFSGYFAAERD